MADMLFRLKTGHVTAAVLDADADALVESWPYRAWLIGTPELYRPYRERTLGLDGRYRTQGSINFVWQMTVTQQQYAWFLDEFFPAGEQSVLVTAKTWDVLGGTWRTVNALMHQPDIADINAVNDAWINQWRVAFTDGTLAATS